MARIPGVTYEKDAKGNKRYMRIDLKKHGAAEASLLKQLEEQNNNSLADEDEAYRQKVYREHAQGISGDEVFGAVKDFLRKLPWDK